MSELLHEKIITFFKESGTKPLDVKELEHIFEMESVDDFKLLVKTLNELEETGQLVRTRKNRYGLPEKMNLIRGKIEMNKKGFAFLIPDEEGESDIYIHSSDLASAMHNDIVIVRLEKKGDRDQRPEGVVIRIIERAIKQIVGTYEDNREFGFVIPDDTRIAHDVFIPKGNANGAITGHKVIVDIVTYPEGRKSAEGEVIQILGHKNDPGIDILSIIYKHGIKIDFPQKVLDQAATTPDKISEEDIYGRRDLRNETIVTIDGADSKDLDDAVCVVNLYKGKLFIGFFFVLLRLTFTYPNGIITV